jgi:predicted MPP superfamily phosphohydrolase
MNDHRITRRDVLRVSSSLIGAAALGRRPLAAVAPLRFGLVTDIHYADIEPAGMRQYRESSAKLAECVRFMNEQKVDFLVELGDFKDQGKPPDEAATLGYLRKIEDVFRGFTGPRFHVLGNHDVDSISKQQFLDVTGVVSRSSPDPGTYYEFGVKGVDFLVLDANFRADGVGYDHGNYAWEDANVPASELRWLEAALTGTGAPVIAFIHQQLDGEGAYFVKNAAAVRAVLERSKKVLAVFQGHRHEGGYSLINGIHYYTLKSVIEGSGLENSSYAIVEADASFNLAVTGYRRAESRRLVRG